MEVDADASLALLEANCARTCSLWMQARDVMRPGRIVVIAGRNHLGRARTLVGEADEFRRLVLAPRLLGDMPVEASVSAQPLG